MVGNFGGDGIKKGGNAPRATDLQIRETNPLQATY